jgi:nitrate reductase delta subunit
VLTFRVLSALLSYPTPDFKEEATQAERILRTDGILTGAHLENVCGLLQRLQSTPQLDAESAYIEAFDRGKSTSLYLFEHIHGESRDRGQAMVRLLMRYRMHGLDLDTKELPDFLPLFLEFLSTCRPDTARKYLSEVIDIVDGLASRLQQRGAPYAAVLEAIGSIVPRKDGQPVSDPGQERDDMPEALDAAWEETPVTFDDAALNAAQGQMDRLSQAGPSRSTSSVPEQP